MTQLEGPELLDPSSAIPISYCWLDGDIFLPGASDCAEQFDITEQEPIEPGSVLVIDHDGSLRQSRDAYDTKVAGVVSGAGTYRLPI